MGRGGRRAGAGRPKGSATRRTAEIADAAMADPAIKTPLDHLLDTLNNPHVGQARKDKVAESLLPYLHPRLSATAMLHAGGQGGNNSDNNERLPDIIFAVPRGAQFAADRRTLIWPDGTPAEPLPLEPFKGTPALTDKRDYPEPSRERFEVREVEAPQNLVRLDVYKSKHDDSDGEPSGAA